MRRPIMVISLTLAALATAAGQTEDRSHLVNFTNKYSQWGRLDWKGDRLTYVGDMPIEQAVDAFFNSLYAGFACRDGSVVPAGPKDRQHPPGSERLRKIAFYSVSGDQALVVEFEKKKLELRGDLPVDAQGREFLGRLWNRYHTCFAEMR